MTTRTTFNDSERALFSITGVDLRAKKVGDRVRDFMATDVDGNAVQLSNVWRSGPLVMVFFRGEHCMPCDPHVQVWRPYLQALFHLGATIVGITPQAPTDFAHSARSDITVLSDFQGDVADAFDLTVNLPPEIVDLYAASGLDSAVLTARGNWVLPVPATYVVDPDGKIIFAHIDSATHQPADPCTVVATLAEHRRKRFREVPSSPWTRPPRAHSPQAPAQPARVIRTRSSRLARLLWLFGADRGG